MSFGIAGSSIVPMRVGQSERSEMVSQILFGELYEMLEETGSWARVRLLYDGSEGWIARGMCVPVSDAYAGSYRAGKQMLSTGMFNIVKKERGYGNNLVVPGSVFPFFDAETGKMKIGEDDYRLVGGVEEKGNGDFRNLVVAYALMYHNTPYLWGGRSPYGIDCSGLVQMAYRLAGIGLPRDVLQQVRCGDDLSFVEEALPGDLAFFGDETGMLTHVGIIWEQSRIIHASGKVRIDKIDHQGIFNEELKRYTHNLKVMRRIFKAGLR